MPSTKSAWISAGATILSALIGGAFLVLHLSPKRTNFSGEIRSINGTPISGARILIAEDRRTPEVSFSDENGVFHVILPESVASVRITVMVNGYETVSRDANPSRTGPEEFVLQPAEPTNKLSSAHQANFGLSTSGNDSPIVVGNGNVVGHHIK